MHIGVIGTGRLGSFRARALRGLVDVDNLILYDQNREVATSLALELEATAVRSISEVIDAGLDALVISTSTVDHVTLVETGIEAGLPIFCEKPISLDLSATDRLVWRVSSSGVQVQVGFQRRFDAGFRMAREKVLRGELGQIYLVRMVGHDHEPPPESFIKGSGGMYRDMHIHEFDLVPWVVGQPIIEVYAEGSVLVDEAFRRHGDVDTTAAVLKLARGALVVLTGSRHNPLGYDVRMELHGSGDSVSVGWDNRAPIRPVETKKSVAGSPYLTFFDRFADAYRAELVEFLRVVKGEIESPSTVEESRQSLRVALAAEISRRDHRPVVVNSVV
ncbi:Gfo/Idh/MocA family oxidoreductase [Dehalococcoidia bacterium]|nr:Gfo/Idh/MocA family oxidoreductase [Dehalococcoidia bacterium]